MIRPFLPKQEEKHTKTMESSTSGFPHLPQSCDHGNRAELAGGAVPNLFRPGNGPKQLGTGSKRSFKSHDGEILSPRATPKSSKSVDHIITMVIYIYIYCGPSCAQRTMANTLEQILRGEQMDNGSLHRPLREQLVAVRKKKYI